MESALVAERTMIIELCGVPGGGKSTLAKAYVERYPHEAGIVALDMYIRWPTFLYGLLFVMRHPIASTYFFMFVFRHHVPGLLRYSLHLAVRACAKHVLAVGRTERYIFIDEGMRHVLATVSGHVVDERDMQKILKRLPRSACTVVAEEGNFHRFHREDVAMHPRVRQGDARLATWEIAVRRNVTALARLLKESGAPVYTISSLETPVEQSVSALRTYITSIA